MSCKQRSFSSTSVHVLAPTTANDEHLQTKRCIAVFHKHERLCAGAAPFTEEHALWTDAHQFVATIDRVTSPPLRQLKMQFAGKICGVAGRVLLDSGAADSYLSHAFTTANNIPIVASPGYAVATSANGSPVTVHGAAVASLCLQSLNCKVQMLGC